MKPIIACLLGFSLFAFSCAQQAPKADAYGNFEADELIVGAEATGKILELRIEEGQSLQAAQVVGRIDSAQLVLKIAQLKNSIQAIAAKSPAIGAQLAVFEKQMNASKQQLATLEREKTRIENLLKKDAAVPKQLDDINAQIDQVHKQMDVILQQRSASDASLNVQKTGLLAEILPLQSQILQVEDQIAKCKIVNPIDGAVLTKLAEAGEIAAFGKPLYKIAQLKEMTLRAYVGGDQLGNIKVGQDVTVSIDDVDHKMRNLTGKITWVASQAEFTPKIVQTRDERVNLVYAFKVQVPNDGSLKIGMPAEVHWTAPAGK
ncbi:MAG: HlyD family efflux transporter periplasmic adaptor subunit [Bacteroidetes bacterium]|nr:HlyD family efflux transporter periplasmic adaptor subunit [Bacteroidota bacterium]